MKTGHDQSHGILGRQFCAGSDPSLVTSATSWLWRVISRRSYTAFSTVRIVPSVSFNCAAASFDDNPPPTAIAIRA